MIRICRFLALALLLGASGTAAQTSRAWHPEDRVVLSDYSLVRAIAGNDSELFIATDLGLLIYDHVFQRWQPPASYLDWYPAGTVTVALADPADGSVWLGTRTSLYHYRPRARIVDSIPVAGGVSDLLLDADRTFDGVYLRGGRGWQFLARGAFQPAAAGRLPSRRIAPLSIAEALDRDPNLDASRAAILVDDALRQSRYTAAFAFPRDERLAMGTDLMGAIITDPLMGQYRRLDYGLAAPGAGSVFVDGHDVWVGSLIAVARGGFTRLSDDLQRVDFLRGPAGTGLNTNAIRDVFVGEGRLWAATDNGLLVMDLPDGRPTMLDSDLPYPESRALLPVDSGVWVGTLGGLVFVDRDLNVSPEWGAPGRQVFDLAAVGDTVWLATDAGLGMVAPEVGRVAVPVSLLDVPGATDPILALAAMGDTIVAAPVDRGELLWRIGSHWIRDPRVTQLGRIRSLVAGEGAVWIGGDRGLAYLDYANNDYRVFNAPRDLPGPVRDLAVTDDHVWVATDGGLVRFSKRALQ